MDKICILIDSGNTRIKARAFVVGHPDASSDLNKAIIDEITIYNQEYARILGFVEKIQRQGQIVKVYGISVATENIRSDLENVFVSLNLKNAKEFKQSEPIIWLESEEKAFSLTNMYESPKQLGVDRWFGIIGAHYHLTQQLKDDSNRALIHVSFGTATTVDCMHNEQLIGGTILPGLQMMFDSLFRGTAHLPKVATSASDIVNFPLNTHAAIQTGVVCAQAGAVFRQVQKLWFLTTQVPYVFISGGAKDTIVDEIRSICSHWSTAAGLPSVECIELETTVLDGLQYFVSKEM
ncbi:type III pantothenate kinase [Taylorella equigenitalis]|uniref:type III pantothenate kinase n=1 Tax=Taylorella equigenitalis TaxID=29575 RepID=UPI000425BDF9|nr:type III pantothenate kinase [Taylorella equigenitalis]WDU46449.1 type III pantothenate kinase [Taylorella equigenitalis]